MIAFDSYNKRIRINHMRIHIQWHSKLAPLFSLDFLRGFIIHYVYTDVPSCDMYCITVFTMRMHMLSIFVRGGGDIDMFVDLRYFL